MKKLKMKFYNEIHPSLSPFISHYWMTEGDLEGEQLQLLPMDHFDITVPIKGSFIYELDGKETIIDRSAFHGFRDQQILVRQERGFVIAFGITFKPWGFYPFIGDDMDQFNNRIVYLEEFLPQVEDVIKQSKEVFDAEELIKNIEAVLLSRMELTDHYLTSVEAIKTFLKSDLLVGEFCEQEGIVRRSFERIFKKYVGISPKKFIALQQFEDASRSLLFEEDSLTEVTYDQEYYDQAHFSHTFKKYTSYSPKDFKKKKPALKSKIDYD